MSRARKSSETICPVRFCGPPQHSKDQVGALSWHDKGGAREIQVKERSVKRPMTGGEGRIDGQQQGGKKNENVWGVGGKEKNVKIQLTAKIREQSKTWQSGGGLVRSAGESKAAQTHRNTQKTSREAAAAAYWPPC